MTNSKNTDTLFILVDDDEVNNLISRLTIESAWSNVDIITFINPTAALEFLRNNFQQRRTTQEAIILLNISMPTLTGWEFLEKFEELSEETKSRINLYVLSASFDKRDKNLAQENKYVIEFLSKPLSTEMVQKIRATAGR